MEILKTKSKNKIHLYLVHRVLRNGVQKRETVFELGNEEDLRHLENPYEFFKKEAAAISRFEDQQRYSRPIPLMEAGMIRNLGCLYIRYALKKLGLIDFLKKKQKESKAGYDFVDVFSTYICSKIIDPSSFRSSWINQSIFFNQYECSLEDLYEFLDKMAEFGQEMEAAMFRHYDPLWKNRKILNIYYDGANFWFETAKPDPDLYDEQGNLAAHGFRSRGFSKENRDPISNIGLMAIDEGFPLDSEFFAGKEKEVAHLPAMIAQLKKDYGIELFSLDADRGNFSGNVIHEIEKDHDYYIIGIPVRIADGKFKYWAMQPDGYVYFRYRKMNPEEEGSFFEKSRTVEKTIRYEGQDGKKHSQTIEQLQLVYKSEPYARKEGYKRAEDLAEDEELIANPKKFTARLKKGAAKNLKDTFLTEDGKEASQPRLGIDQKAVEERRTLDEIYGIASNDFDLFPVKMYRTYRRLMYDEADFRILKSELELRPAGVWKQDHIVGYLFMCIISLAVLRYLERLLGARFTTEQIENGLRAFFCLRTENKDYQIAATNEVIEALRKKTGVGFDHQYNTKRDILRVMAWKSFT